MASWMVGWLAGWLAGWLIGWLGGWFVDYLVFYVCLPALLPALLPGHHGAHWFKGHSGRPQLSLLSPVVSEFLAGASVLQTIRRISNALRLVRLTS